MTYSIVARDPETGQLGVAVQSHYFSVGRWCPFARPGVGAVATQSMVEPSYGPLGLELMAAGKTPEQALRGLTAADELAEVRQVAMVDATGRVATHTGSKCIADAGHRSGDGWSVQANMMRNDTVWGAMAEAFETSTGPLPERLLVAFDAAEAEGGDIRGRQSAAMVVVGPGGLTDEINLRVEDHAEPVTELRRLLALRRAYDRVGAAEHLVRDGDVAAIEEEHRRLQELDPGNPELAFWLGVALATTGKVDEARVVLELAYAVHDGWAELLKRLPAAGRLPDDPALLRRLLPNSGT